MFGPPDTKYPTTAWVVSYDGVLHAIALNSGEALCTAKMRGHSWAEPFVVEVAGGSYQVVTSDASGYLYAWDPADCSKVWEILVNDPGPYEGP